MSKKSIVVRIEWDDDLIRLYADGIQHIINHYGISTKGVKVTELPQEQAQPEVWVELPDNNLIGMGEKMTQTWLELLTRNQNVLIEAVRQLQERG